VQTVTIAQSEVLSGAFTLGVGAKASIFVPSGDLGLLRAARRHGHHLRHVPAAGQPTPANSGEVRLNAGVGSLAYHLPEEIVGAAEYFRHRVERRPGRRRRFLISKPASKPPTRDKNTNMAQRLDIVLAVPGLPFNGETVQRQSLGGSETAGYYIARELAAMGPSRDRVLERRARACGTTSPTCPWTKWRGYSSFSSHDVNIVQRSPLMFTSASPRSSTGCGATTLR
jgi:hypothetical protein